MYFDPLTSWLVALIADGIVISSEHVSDSQMSEHYRESERRINNGVNGDILRIKTRGYFSAEDALENIKATIERAKDSYEIRHGYAKLKITRESYEFMIQLCEECKEDYEEKFRTYNQIYQNRKSNGESEQGLINLRETVQKYKSKSIVYQSILESARIGREKAIQEEEERARKLAEQDSNGVIIIKSVLAIGLCIFGFVMMFNVGGLIGPLALIGAAIGGAYIMNMKFDEEVPQNDETTKFPKEEIVKCEPLDIENYVSSEWKNSAKTVRCAKCSSIYLDDMKSCPSCGHDEKKEI